MLDGMGRCAWAQAVEGCAVSGTIIGIPTVKDPENGNGQVAPEEVKRVRLECEHIEEFNAQDMADKLSETVKSLQQQEYTKMNNQQHRSDDQIKRVKECLKKVGDNKLRAMYAQDGDRQLSALAYLELSARSNTPSVYEVVAITGDEAVERYLKRAISDEYVDSLLGGCDEVRIRKVEIK